MSDDQLYTKADMEKAIQQTREGTEPPSSRRTYTDEELRAEVIKAATLAGQIAARHQHLNAEALAPTAEAQAAGGFLMTMGQVEVAVQKAIGNALVQLFDDLGLPIGTREEKRQTVLKLEEMMKLNTTSRKFVVGVIATVASILTTVLGGFLLWLFTHGGAAVH